MLTKRIKTLISLLPLMGLFFTNSTYAEMKLTKNIINDETVEVFLDVDDDIKQVRLPSGNTINGTDLTYTLKGNGVYTFAGYTESGEIIEKKVTINKLRSNYLRTPIVTVDLDLESEDALSGVVEMRFRNETDNENKQWTSFENYDVYKRWNLERIEGIRTVQVQYKDRADNISNTVEDKIILDMSGPVVNSFNINNDDKYTRFRDVQLYSNVVDTYSIVELGQPSNNNVDFTTLAYKPVLPWTLPGGDGEKTVYFRAVDDLGNIGDVVTDTIVLDEEIPQGSIQINNGEDFVKSENVKLHYHFRDMISGIAQVNVYEGSHKYEFSNIPENPGYEEYGVLDWTLNTDTPLTYVTLEIIDNAGNVYRTDSQEVRIISLKVVNFYLDDVINPAKYPDGFIGPLEWGDTGFPPVSMLSGGDFDFRVKYDINDRVLDKYDLKWKFSVYADNTLLNPEAVNEWLEVGIDYDSKMITGKFKVPFEMDDGSGGTMLVPKGSKISIYIELEGISVWQGRPFAEDAQFPADHTRAIIGIIDGDIREYVKFNEIQ